MDTQKARAEFEAGRLSEVLVEPADEGNGWMVVVKSVDGDQMKLTDHGGHERVYHTLDHATEAAKAIGFGTVRVEEPF